jgi:long-chain acyl-CoA synthetase
MMLIHQLIADGAARRPDRIAFHWVDRNRSLTYAQAASAVDAAAGVLHHLGVRKGDRVTIFAHNGLDYLVAMFGCFRIGAVAALVNVKFAGELKYYLANHRPHVVIYTHDMRDAVVPACEAVETVRHLLCMDGAQEGALSWPELMEAGFASPPDPADDQAIAHLSYTSGTSGQPKGACLPHAPVVRATRCIAERLRISSEDVSFGPTALSSSYQLVSNILPLLHHQCTVNVMRFWEQKSGYDALEATGASVFAANPTLLAELLDESRTRGGRTPSRLRLGLSGGGSVAPTLKRGWRDDLKLPLIESYGQSELGGFVALGGPELPSDQEIGAIGRTLPDKEVRIFDHNGHEVKAGEVGEIVLRGGFMKGYWDMPEKTEEALRNQWLHTGDLGFLDLEGRLTLRGRRSELIVVDGEPWFPRDVEEALMLNPGVAQAALIGIPDEQFGERPAAFVTRSSGSHIDIETLRTYAAAGCHRDLSGMTITFVDALPMTPTGKISKAQLADIATGGGNGGA